MKTLIIILVTALCALGATALLDWPWVALNPVRYGLVVLFVLGIVCAGFKVLVTVFKE